MIHSNALEMIVMPLTQITIETILICGLVRIAIELVKKAIVSLSNSWNFTEDASWSRKPEVRSEWRRDGADDRRRRASRSMVAYRPRG